jgi:hypothetical protein
MFGCNIINMNEIFRRSRGYLPSHGFRDVTSMPFVRAAFRCICLGPGADSRL